MNSTWFCHPFGLLHRMVQFSATPLPFPIASKRWCQGSTPPASVFLYNLALNKSHRHHLFPLQIYTFYLFGKKKWFKPKTVASSCGRLYGELVPAEDPTSPTWLMNAKTQSMEQIPNLMVATWRLPLEGLVCWGVFQDIRFLEDGRIYSWFESKHGHYCHWMVGWGRQGKFS